MGTALLKENNSLSEAAKTNHSSEKTNRPDPPTSRPVLEQELPNSFLNFERLFPLDSFPFHSWMLFRKRIKILNLNSRLLEMTADVSRTNTAYFLLSESSRKVKSNVCGLVHNPGESEEPEKMEL